jgi:hypothetical protein
MTLTTAAAILAVDFRAFPRRLGKTETFGVGLMDVGSGSFVLANALVSRRVRAAGSTPGGGGGGQGSHGSLLTSAAVAGAGIVKMLKGVAPLVVLAAIRGATTAAADYQVPVGEYGRHWNFFATLAAVRALAAALPVPPRWSAAAGALVLAAHQMALSTYLGGLLPAPLGPYLARHERGPGLWEQNKEGLGSIPGYFALYLLGAGVGHVVERSMVTAAARARAEDANRVRAVVAGAKTEAAAARKRFDEGGGGERGESGGGGDSGGDSGGSAGGGVGTASAQQLAVAANLEAVAAEIESKAPERMRAGPGGGRRWAWAWKWLAQMAALDAWFWTATLMLHHLVEPVSRRTANAAYCTWMLAFNLQVVLAFVAVGLAFPAAPPVPRLLAAVNRRLLPVFLAANLLTGGVNLSMDTMAASDLVAWGVMTAYLGAVCGGALGLDALLGGGQSSEVAARGDVDAAHGSRDKKTE